MDLMQDEALIWQGRPSWRAMMSFWFAVIVLAVVVLVVGILIDQTTWFGLAAAIILAGGLAKGWLERVSTQYTVTDRRIIIRRGILSRKERAAHIDRVQNVNLAQSFFDRLFGVGTLDFDTAGTEDSDFKFLGIAGPDKLRTRIDTEYVRRTREMPSGMS